MNDMTRVIVPDSSQINADDLQTGPMTVTITEVKIKGGKEQPVSIGLAGMEKVYRPCKSMARILVGAWGADSSKYIGRSLTLYCDPKVTWAGMAVGGLRISHMSDIDSAMTMALTATRGNKKPFTVRPLESRATRTATPQNIEPAGAPIGSEAAAGVAATISADEALRLEARCTDNSVKIANVKKFFKVERFSQMTCQQLADAHKMIDDTLAQRQQQ